MIFGHAKEQFHIVIYFYYAFVLSSPLLPSSCIIHFEHLPLPPYILFDEH